MKPEMWPTPPTPPIDPNAPILPATNVPVADAAVSVLPNEAPPLAMLSPTMMGALPVTLPYDSLVAYWRVLVTTCVPVSYTHLTLPTIYSV